MISAEEIRQFYSEFVENSAISKRYLKGPCPFCGKVAGKKPGTIVVDLNPDSLFLGYFRCSTRCTPGGFPLHFGRMMKLDPRQTPGSDIDREPIVRQITYPEKKLTPEIREYHTLMGDKEFIKFREMGVSKRVVQELGIGFNGQYFVYPYFLDDKHCYAIKFARTGPSGDMFWKGDEDYIGGAFCVFNIEDIDRCENGSLFVTVGENNLAMIRQAGFPGVAVPTDAALEGMDTDQLKYLNQVYVCVSNTPQARLSARILSTRLGFKARIVVWPSDTENGADLCSFARKTGEDYLKKFHGMVRAATAFSPFSSPEKEFREFTRRMKREVGSGVRGFSTGFKKLDDALSGIRGINIIGGLPKAGKSCLTMQISTEMARRGVPIIYYDFENGRQKIYARTLKRIGRLSMEDIEVCGEDPDVAARYDAACQEMKKILKYFRVVTDRKLNPEIMRRQISFLQHETHSDGVVVVVDSLHKLPFDDLSDRRTGIDAWLREMESMRDELGAAFFVISELSRSGEGEYSKKPDLASFKESGDIEYSADNAIILMPDWDPLTTTADQVRKSTLWVVASRENNPGKVADFGLDYPYWGFKEL